MSHRKSKKKTVSSGRKRTSSSAVTTRSSEPSTVLSQANKERTRRSQSSSSTSRVASSTLRSRIRANPLKSQLPNRNVPEEASAVNLVDQPVIVFVGSELDPKIVYDKKVRQEFHVSVSKDLANLKCNPERFLKPEANQKESYLDREVEPQKVIDFLVNYMDTYFDLSSDPDAFSRARQQMDDDLWNNLGYIIPMLCRQMIHLVSNEHFVMNVHPDALVFGDVHGNLTDVYHIYKSFISNPEYAHYKFVFLGDYVDRGPKPVEILCFLFALKLAHPGRFVLLRGNHEVLKVNAKYGLYSICAKLFEDIYVKHPGVLVDLNYRSFNRVFCYMPVAAVIKGTTDRGVFCCHGGVPSQYIKPEAVRNTGWTIEDLNVLMTKPAILNPSKRAMPQEQAINEILWNDPIPKRLREKERFKRKLFYLNKKRGGHCSFFTEGGLRAFLEANQLAMVIRGHQYRHCKETGFKSDFGGLLLTVFSSSNYCGTERNSTGYAVVSGDECRVTPRTLRHWKETAKQANFNQLKIVINPATKEVSQVIF